MGWDRALLGCLGTNCGRWPSGPEQTPATPTCPLWVCFLGRLSAGDDAAGPQSSHFISGHRPWAPLFQFWERPLPGPEVALEVLEAEWREVGAQPLPDPPLALGGMRAPRAAELVLVVLSPDPPAGRGAACQGTLGLRVPGLCWGVYRGLSVHPGIPGGWGRQPREVECPTRSPHHSQPPDQTTWGQGGLQERRPHGVQPREGRAPSSRLPEPPCLGPGLASVRRPQPFPRSPCPLRR